MHTGVKHFVKNKGAMIRTLSLRRKSRGETDQNPLPPTSSLTNIYITVVQRVRSDAEKLLGHQLPSRFTDEEVMRYALHYGILRADSAASKEDVIQVASSAIKASCDWFSVHQFASVQELQEYSHLAWWKYSPGTDDRPVLCVDIGRAVDECTGKKALHFANAIITLMELAIIGSPLSGIQGHAHIDRIDVVINANGVSALSASKVFWILRAVVKTLSHHYPGRLNQLTLLDLPVVLNWIITGVKRLVHDDTARKLVSKSS